MPLSRYALKKKVKRLRSAIEDMGLDTAEDLMHHFRRYAEANPHRVSDDPLERLGAEVEFLERWRVKVGKAVDEHRSRQAHWDRVE